MSSSSFHAPVMVDEIVELFAPTPAGTIIDATVGGGGHSVALLTARADRQIFGIDQDKEAVQAARARLGSLSGRVRVEHARFDELGDLADGIAGPIVGVLFDLGVSSHQLDSTRRGFSYRNDGPLDMRMDTDRTVRAHDIVNGWDEKALSGLFFDHGESRFARRIARSVIANRPIVTTAALAEVVTGAIPAAARRRGHPARRVFQALRVAVNGELDLLEPALHAAIAITDPGGRVAVLSYHSGEDRIVKATFRDEAMGGCHCPPGLPCVCGASPAVRLLTRGARMASATEREANPRAESARLRAVEVLASGASDREADR